MVCLTPTPCGTRTRACLSSTCLRFLCVARRPSPPRLRLSPIDSAWLGRSGCTVVSLEGTRCKSPAVQSHPLPLLCWPTTCTSGRVEKIQGEQRTQWMHANSVGESVSDTCGYKNPPNLLRLQTQKLAYCECVCVYVRVCMCPCLVRHCQACMCV